MNRSIKENEDLLTACHEVFVEAKHSITTNFGLFIIDLEHFLMQSMNLEDLRFILENFEAFQPEAEDDTEINITLDYKADPIKVMMKVNNALVTAGLNFEPVIMDADFYLFTLKKI